LEKLSYFSLDEKNDGAAFEAAVQRKGVEIRTDLNLREDGGDAALRRLQWIKRSII
jgi:hypothetical protein